MSTSSKVDSALEEAQAEIRELRARLETLTTERVEPALREAAGHAKETMQRASKIVQDEADQAADFVRQRPITSVLTAAAIGFLAARLTR